MVKRFENDDAGFKKWIKNLKENDAFVFDCKNDPGHGPVLHKIHCPQVTEQEGVLTAVPKACARDRGKLEAWASAEYPGKRLTACECLIQDIHLEKTPKIVQQVIAADDPLMETLETKLKRRPYRCPHCGDNRRLLLDPQGPFMACKNPRCQKREVIAQDVLEGTIQELGVKCAKCGSDVQIAGEDKNFAITCVNAPECDYTSSWPGLRVRLRQG